MLCMKRLYRSLVSHRLVMLPNDSSKFSLTYQQFKVPELEAGMVHVKLCGSAFNIGDYHMISGRSNRLDGKSCVLLGRGGSYRVHSVGEGVTSLTPGDRVIMTTGRSSYQFPKNYGSFALDDVILEENLYKIPNNISNELSTCIAGSPLISLVLLENFVKLKEGDGVLIHGYAGHFTMCLSKLCAARGIKTFFLIPGILTDQHVEDLLNMGATSVISSGDNVNKENLRKESIQLGIDVGSSGSPKNLLRYLSPGATLVYMGNSRMNMQNISAGELIFSNKIVTGFLMGQWAKRNPKFFDFLDEIVKYAEEGLIPDPPFCRLIRLEDFNELINYKPGDGKYILVPN